ncbi:MAG: alpha/beta-hydrolase family protein [Candidatus Nanopelagicales bacterium]
MTDTTSPALSSGAHRRLARFVARERGLDVSARAGLLLGAAGVGLSYQRNLLSRNSVDQAVISGVAAASWYSWGVSAHSLLRSAADRLPAARGSTAGRVVTGLVVDGITLAAGVALVRALPPREHESPRRALLRLAATGKAGAAAAGIGAGLLEPWRGRPGSSLANLGAAAAVGAAAYALTRPRQQVAGADSQDGASMEDTQRAVSPAQAAGLGLAVTGGLLGLAHVETRLTTTIARGAAFVLGGEVGDHRALGRLGSAAVTGAVAWAAVSAVVTKLNSAGNQTEAAHAEAPDLPEVTGSPQSHIPWAAQSREGRRWLSMVLRADHIERVMGEPAKQPIRVYAAMSSAPTEEERAQLLLREIDRTKALERKVFALFSPTGSGYVNYVADETLEYLTRGDCASAAIEYSVLPSSLSLTSVHLGTRQTRMVVDGIVSRLMAMPAERRPQFVLFGESLGSQVSEEMFAGTGMLGPEGAGLDAAVWIGTPAATVWRQQLWGDRTVADVPDVGPGTAYLPRAIRDWHGLAPDERAGVRFLLLQNGDDPVPKFHAPLLWRPPDWLGPDDRRPPGAPRGTRWLPVVTFFATFVDLLNALTPTPGVFVEGGHDYRVEIPEALRTVWRLDCSDEQMARVQQALRERELGWETYRQWAEAEAKSGDDRAKAEAKVEAEVGTWTGGDGPVDAAAVEEVIRDDTQPG